MRNLFGDVAIVTHAIINDSPPSDGSWLEREMRESFGMTETRSASMDCTNFTGVTITYADKVIERRLFRPDDLLPGSPHAKTIGCRCQSERYICPFCPVHFVEVESGEAK